MSIGVKTGRFKFQRGTKKEREGSNLILLDGELAIEADTRKIKIGDGKSEYSELPYISIGQIDATSLDEDVLKLISGPKGKDGKDLTFDDLTADQKAELKGEKGQDGTVEFDELTEEQKESLKGEAPLVFSTNPPQDTKVLWVKHDNVRNIYEKIDLRNDEVVYYGELNTLLEIKDQKELSEMNVAVTNNSNIEVNSIYAIKVEEKVIIPIEKKSGPGEYSQYIFLRVSDEDLEFLSKNLGNIYGSFSEYGYGANYVNYPVYTINEFKLMKKINEETYLTLNVYNVLTNKWEKID